MKTLQRKFKLVGTEKLGNEGYDTQMQTNHLSHFLLAAELFPLLQAEAESSGAARIVTHSSLGRLHTVNKGLEDRCFAPKPNP